MLSYLFNKSSKAFDLRITRLNVITRQFLFFDYLDDRLEKIDDFHKTDEIIKFFKGQYNEKDAKKISDFYFYENGNLKNGTTKLESIINVSIFCTSNF